MSTALMLGVALAIVCLAYVLYPIVGGRAQVPRSDSSPARRTSAAVTDEEIEAAIKAYRDRHLVGGDCAVCGPRSESDALFCSNCGRPLERIHKAG